MLFFSFFPFIFMIQTSPQLHQLSERLLQCCFTVKPQKTILLTVKLHLTFISMERGDNDWNSCLGELFLKDPAQSTLFTFELTGPVSQNFQAISLFFLHLLLSPNFLPLSVFLFSTEPREKEREREGGGEKRRMKVEQREEINHPPPSEFGFCCCSPPSWWIAFLQEKTYKNKKMKVIK